MVSWLVRAQLPFLHLQAPHGPFLQEAARLADRNILHCLRLRP